MSHGLKTLWTTHIDNIKADFYIQMTAFVLPAGVSHAVDLCAAPGSWSQVLSRKLRSVTHKYTWSVVQHWSVNNTLRYYLNFNPFFCSVSVEKTRVKMSRLWQLICKPWPRCQVSHKFKETSPRCSSRTVKLQFNLKTTAFWSWYGQDWVIQAAGEKTLWTLFTFLGFYEVEDVISCVNFYCVKCKLQQIYVLHSHLPENQNRKSAIEGKKEGGKKLPQLLYYKHSRSNVKGYLLCFFCFFYIFNYL